MDRFNLDIWKRKCVVVGLLAVVGPASSQFPMQMFQMPPMMMAPPPPPPPASSPATTTEPPTPENSPQIDGNVAFAVPAPMPMPLQVAVPALPPPSFCAGKPCPPCPPCLCAPTCTPSFFSYCSPCHKKCRCTNGKEPPEPLPPVPPLPAPGPAFALPMPMMPPPAIMVPMPPFPRITQARDSCSSESHGSVYSSSLEYSDDNSSNCDDDGYNKKSSKRGRRKQRRKKSRRRMDSNSDGDGDRYLIQPMLSFMDSSGEVQLKRPLSAADVRHLTADSREDKHRRYIAEWLHTNTNLGRSITTGQNVRRISDEDNINSPQILIISDYKPKTKTKQTKHVKERSKKLVSKPHHQDS